MAHRTNEVVVLNPSKDHPMRSRRLNPDNLMDSAKDVGKAAALAIPAAALVGAGAYAVSRVDYGPDAAGAMFTAADKGKAALLAGSMLAAVAMQFSDKTAMVGKLLGAGAVVLVGAPMVASKLASAMAPAATAPAAGMGFLTGYNYPAPSFAAAAPSLAAPVQPSAGMGFNSGVSSYYRAA